VTTNAVSSSSAQSALPGDGQVLITYDPDTDTCPAPPPTPEEPTPAPIAIELVPTFTG
jgi:hypothetical protein